MLKILFSKFVKWVWRFFSLFNFFEKSKIKESNLQKFQSKNENEFSVAYTALWFPCLKIKAGFLSKHGKSIRETVPTHGGELIVSTFLATLNFLSFTTLSHLILQPVTTKKYNLITPKSTTKYNQKVQPVTTLKNRFWDVLNETEYKYSQGAKKRRRSLWDAVGQPLTILSIKTLRKKKASLLSRDTCRRTVPQCNGAEGLR